MKKFIVILLAMVFVFTASYASAEGPYVSGNLGATLTSDSTLSVLGINATELEFDTGWAFGGAVGYDLGNNTRLEGEVAYRSADIDKVTILGVPVDPSGEVNVLSFLLNGYYDIKVDAPVTPFITGGIGFANIELSDDVDSYDDNVFAYQIGAGLGYAVNDLTTIDFGYRYMGTSDPEYEDSGIQVDSEYASHNFYIGVRYAIK
ncbi:MAG: porin family protein [Nitrospirae bacterium]|nr:porin family protein [Nitrospirota bacterium]